jgi:site-specific DNA-methyltransferase (adenine-specific)
METNIIKGDSKVSLMTLAEKSVDCIVTSPPYYNLRDYEVEGQLGAEKDYKEYISKLCDVFDECKRVLKDKGSFWLNIGDTYGADKNLLNIPARVSVELQNRGWILRNTIIWKKVTCMPAPIKDRFTVDFEYLFFFVKQSNYYFKQQLELLAQATIERKKYGWHGRVVEGIKRNQPEDSAILGDRWGNPAGRNMRCVWTITPSRVRGLHFATFPKKLVEIPISAGCPDNGTVLDPFCGSGTTGLVAIEQNKSFIGIDLNEKYCKIAEDRIKEVLKIKEEESTIKKDIREPLKRETI